MDKNKYITRCHGRLDLFGVRVAVQFQSQLETRCRSESQRQTEGLGSQDSDGQPSRMRRKWCYNTEELGVNMWQSVQSPTHLSHITNINPFATLSRIKCEKYIFIKKCVRSSLLLIMFPHVHVYVCGYTTHCFKCIFVSVVLYLYFIRFFYIEPTINGGGTNHQNN